MARAARLLELLIRLQTRPRFTAAELATEFGVSRRTILRDLQELSLLGVPLVAAPGRGGGYRLAWPHRPPTLALTADEAIGLVLAYEAFLGYAQSPFAPESLSAVTKLRAALPPAALRHLDRVREHVAVVEFSRDRPAPHLPELLAAALEGRSVRVVYDSRAGRSVRTVWPLGLYAADGLWYCAGHDSRRGHVVSLRADRVRSLEPAAETARPALPSFREWLRDREQGGAPLPFRARLTERGATDFEVETLFGAAARSDREGWVIEATIPAAEVAWFAARLLSAGTEIVVESPPALIAAMRRRAEEVAALYREAEPRAE